MYTCARFRVFATDETPCARTDGDDGKSRSSSRTESFPRTPSAVASRDSTTRSILRGSRASTARARARARPNRRARAATRHSATPRAPRSVRDRRLARRSIARTKRSRRTTRPNRGARRANARERDVHRCGNGIRRGAPSGFVGGGAARGDARANARGGGRRLETVEGNIDRRSRASGGEARRRARGGGDGRRR